MCRPQNGGRGSVRLRQGDADRAIADFTAAIKLRPDFALAFFNRGRWWVNAASAAGFTLAAYLLFTAFLQVVLPRGILDF